MSTSLQYRRSKRTCLWLCQSHIATNASVGTDRARRVKSKCAINAMVHSAFSVAACPGARWHVSQILRAVIVGERIRYLLEFGRVSHLSFLRMSWDDQPVRSLLGKSLPFRSC